MSTRSGRIARTQLAGVVGLQRSLPLRSTGYRCCFIGDSITGYDASNNCYGYWPAFMCHLSQGKLLHLRNAGIAGNTTTQMVARFSTDILAHYPDLVFIMGGANDVTGNVSLDTIVSNILSMCTSSTLAGAVPIVCGLTPLENTGVRGVDGLTYGQAVGKLSVRLAHECNRRGILFIDPSRPCRDPATNHGWIAAHTADTVHPTSLGHEVIGAEAWRLISPLVPESCGLILPTHMQTATSSTAAKGYVLGGNAFSSNASSKQTDGTYDIPRGFYYANTGSTAGVVSWVADANIVPGGEWWQWDANAAQTTQRQALGWQTSNGAVSPGDRIAAFGRYQMDAGFRAANGQITINVGTQTTGGTGVDNMGVLAAWKLDMVQAGGGVFYGELVASATASKVVWATYIQVATGTSSAVVRFADFAVVNLTALGVTSLGSLPR